MNNSKVINSDGAGLVGMWWYFNEEERVLGTSKSVNKGVLDGSYIQYSVVENHLTLWRRIIEKSFEDKAKVKEVVDKGYKSIERGRVIYNIEMQTYEIICSEALSNNKEALKKIVEFYNLANSDFNVEALSHYYVVDTTNPEILKFEYGTGFN